MKFPQNYSFRMSGKTWTDSYSAAYCVWKNVVVIPKGQQGKIEGAICNVPVDCDQTCNILPTTPWKVKKSIPELKRKLWLKVGLFSSCTPWNCA